MKIITLSSLAMVSLLALTSCLKDKEYDNSTYGINLDKGDNAIIFSNAPKKSIGINLTGTTTTYSLILLSASSLDAPTQDIQVTVAEKPSLVTAANLTPLPPGTLVAVTGTTFKKGLIQDTLRITFNSTLALDLAKTYGLGLTLTSASGGYKTAGTGNDILISINIKNAYDGNYHAVGYFYHPSAPRAIDRTVTLATVGEKVSSTNLGDLANPISLTVDANNNVTVADLNGNVGVGPTTSLSALPSPYTPFAGSNPTIYTNKYDPATKTFYLRYGYQGGSGPRTVEEILTKE